jgi:hypothetical protein
LRLCRLRVGALCYDNSNDLAGASAAAAPLPPVQPPSSEALALQRFELKVELSSRANEAADALDHARALLALLQRAAGLTGLRLSLRACASAYVGHVLGCGALQELGLRFRKARDAWEAALALGAGLHQLTFMRIATREHRLVARAGLAARLPGVTLRVSEELDGGNDAGAADDNVWTT